MTHIALILALAALGPLQGGAVRHLKFPSRILIALIFGFLLSSHFGLWWWGYSIVVWLALAPGVGQHEGYLINRHKFSRKVAYAMYDKGGKYSGLESWQWEGLRHWPWLSHFVRDLFFLNPCFSVASCVAMFVGVRLPHIWHMEENRWHECLHYSTAYLLTLLALSL